MGPDVVAPRPLKRAATLPLRACPAKAWPHVVLRLLAREFGGKCAAGAFAAVELVQGGAEIGDGEIGPAFGQENEFGEGALPEEEVGEALLASGADEQIDFRRAPSVDFREDPAEGVGREFGGFIEFARGVEDGLTSGVVDGQADVEARATHGDRFGVGDDLAESCGNAVAATDDAQTDAFVEAMGGFDKEIFVEDAQDGVDFSGRALPVGGREREEGERVNAECGSGFDQAPCGFGAGTVSGGTRKAAGGGPAAVAVGNDGDVEALCGDEFGPNGGDWDLRLA
jgi:hypothetical protein